MSVLEKIHTPADLKKIPVEDFPLLAQEIRQFILTQVASKQGHLAAGLGVVELTIALHYVFDTPKDVLIWDVGHQAYPHKILTGRREAFATNRQWGGISGFPTREESPYDAFGTGHSSTSISAAVGMAVGARLRGDTHTRHIAVIGDASLGAGMAFEALNHAGQTGANVLVILNDNQMSIDPSVGALGEYLQQISSPEKETFFSDLQWDFLGSVDGHNFPELLEALRRAAQKNTPRILHVRTVKGKGFAQAERDAVRYHAPSPFELPTGDFLPEQNAHLPKYQQIFGETLVELAQNNPKIVGVTPAMLSGSSLGLLKEKFPQRTFDVGIAEQHAVTFCAGLASQGFTPYCAIYSTFLQRAYDQIIHDVALQNLPVVFCIDRAGLVGEDGATHQGVFDVASLRCIPNLVIFAPLDAQQLRHMLYTVQLPDWQQPVAIRYPRGRVAQAYLPQAFEKIPVGKSRQLKQGTSFAVLSFGAIGQNVTLALQQMPNAEEFAHYDMRFAKPLDEEALHLIFQQYQKIFTVEDGVLTGGFGQAVAAFATEHSYGTPLKMIGIPDVFVPHGSLRAQQHWVGLSPQALKDFFVASRQF